MLGDLPLTLTRLMNSSRCLAGGLTDSPGQLVAARAAMGVGAAMVFPSTLSLLTNVFTERRERAAAIGLWGAIAGMAIALGPILLSRQPFANLEMELKTRRGARWISLSGDPIIDMTGTFQGFRGVGQDVTDVRRTQERLTNLANMDVLSGLPNRGRVRQLLGEALSNAQATNVP